MLVSYRMTKEPITVEPDDLLSRAAHKMKAGGTREPTNRFGCRRRIFSRRQSLAERL